jgi:hypothetical protein
MFLGLCWGRATEGYRIEIPSRVRVIGIKAEMMFTIKSLVVLFLFVGLFVEEPWRMKLRLNVLMVVTEDVSVFSAKKKQMGICSTQKMEKQGGRIAQMFAPHLASHSCM